MRARTAIVAAVALAVGVLTPTAAQARPVVTPGPVALGNPQFTANVMAPLKITDWAAFDSQLSTVKGYGVDAVSVDVWWGDVEGKADNKFDWAYYDKVFAKITKAGLDIAPILSFHQCGGNVGDDYTSLLPSWLWKKYAGRSLNGVKIGIDGLKYKSEQGNFSGEVVQGWADRLVTGEYRDFTKAFTKHFGRTYRKDVTEINVSLGSSGELRYPSYNAHDTNTGYPTRGGLQAYSTLAVADFQHDMSGKYRSLGKINKAWGTAYTSYSQIAPPADAEKFFTSDAYRSSTYGRDFIDWYNGSLIEHGKSMLSTVIKALGSSFKAATIGYKVPGIHWAMTNPAYPRAAEVAAGLVQTSINMDSTYTGHGYRKIIDLAKDFKRSGRTIVMHFTCLEMGDQNFAPQYSLAKTLVSWIGQYAYLRGVPLKGENALNGGVQYDFGWDQINDAFDNSGYLGLTVLRMADVSTGTGATRYAAFIAKYRP